MLKEESLGILQLSGSESGETSIEGTSLGSMGQGLGTAEVMGLGNTLWEHSIVSDTENLWQGMGVRVRWRHARCGHLALNRSGQLRAKTNVLDLCWEGLWFLLLAIQVGSVARRLLTCSANMKGRVGGSSLERCGLLGLTLEDDLGLLEAPHHLTRSISLP